MIRYFDNAAASRPDPEVLDFYLRSMQEDFANQEAVHLLAYQVRRDLAAAEKELCEAFFADPESYNVTWAGSATECFRIVAAFLEGCKVLSSNSEHPALSANFKRYTGLQLLPVSSDGAIVLPPEPDSADAVIFHHVQSETGAIQDLDRLFAA
ncbi:MAG: aminotransferase class V-fold PLP-dependent enzyme, partial [Lentisphaeria bacterium]|nr:aminotransferase class V-fold PLP-dependent enzyme [Lentisphaeria bacterium]